LNVKSLFTVKRWGKPDLKIVLSQEKNIISETSQIARLGIGDDNGDDNDRETASGDDNGAFCAFEVALLSCCGGVVFATRVFPVKLLVDTDLRVCPILKYC
jgi:hypothetical protein